LKPQAAAREEGVYQVHDWAKVRELHRQGVSKKAIARRLCMSRNTVARLVAHSTQAEHPFHGKPNGDSLQAERHRSEATRLPS
jgi:orotate phosphoribosyltransferase-like protein